MAYRIDISKPALRDAESIFHWLNAISQQKAADWLKDIIMAKDSLKELPNRCPIAPESRSFLIEIRHLIFGRHNYQWRIIYRVSVDETTGEDVVRIYRIRDSRQRMLDDLEIIGESYDD